MYLRWASGTVTDCQSVSCRNKSKSAEKFVPLIYTFLIINGEFIELTLITYIYVRIDRENIGALLL